jgi:hypothetical protein
MQTILLVAIIPVFWALTSWFCIRYHRKTERLWHELNPNRYRYVYNWGDELHIATFSPVAVMPILMERVKYNKAKKQSLRNKSNGCK